MRVIINSNLGYPIGKRCLSVLDTPVKTYFGARKRGTGSDAVRLRVLWTLIPSVLRAPVFTRGAHPPVLAPSALTPALTPTLTCEDARRRSPR